LRVASSPSSARVRVSGRRHNWVLLILPLPAAFCDRREQSAAWSGSLFFVFQSKRQK